MARWVSSPPTAHASSAEMAVTLSSAGTRGAPGVGTLVQAAPSQCWVTGEWTAPVSASPTAQMSAGPEAETDSSNVNPPWTLGVCTTLQADPSQCSARVLY